MAGGLWYTLNGSGYRVFTTLEMLSVSIDFSGSITSERHHGFIQARDSEGTYQFDFSIRSIPRPDGRLDDVATFLGGGSSDLLVELTAYLCKSAGVRLNGRWADKAYSPTSAPPLNLIRNPSVSSPAPEQAYHNIICVLVQMLGGSVSITREDIVSMGSSPGLTSSTIGDGTTIIKLVSSDSSTEKQG